MGKRLQNRRKYKYTMHEFKDIVCSQCAICDIKTTPDFCYTEVYKTNPKLFMRVIFNKLVLNNKVNFTDSELVEFVQDVFCNSNFCKEGIYTNDVCEFTSGCVAVFKKQMYETTDSSLPKQQKKSKYSRKKKNRYVPVPYPTFFCNKEFMSEVKRIIDGNTAKKQDTSQELSR